MSFRAVAQKVAGGDERNKRKQTQKLEGQERQRMRASGRSEAALRSLDRHDPAEREHSDNDGDARITKLFVNLNPLGGNQEGLRDQDHQPTGKDDAVNDEKRRQVQLGEEAVEIERAREAGEDECGGEDGDEEIETAVAKTRRQCAALSRAGGHVFPYLVERSWRQFSTRAAVHEPGATPEGLINL